MKLQGGWKNCCPADLNGKKSEKAVKTNERGNPDAQRLGGGAG